MLHDLFFHYVFSLAFSHSIFCTILGCLGGFFTFDVLHNIGEPGVPGKPGTWGAWGLGPWVPVGVGVPGEPG